MNERRVLTARGTNWSVRERVGETVEREQFVSESGLRTILIHGFANPVHKASQAYDAFARKMEDVMWPNSVSRATSLWEYHWPGDHPRAPLNPMTYNARIDAADSSGRILGELLQRVDSSQTVLLIAHSLGCRVALAAVRRLMFLEKGGAPGSQLLPPAEREGPNLLVFLLAAAVPVNACKPAPLRDGAQENFQLDDLDHERQFALKRSRTAYSVLFSGRDIVLRATFPLGQLMHSTLEEAVGLSGGPDMSPAGPGRWDMKTNTGLRHGKYWHSHFVAAQIVEFIHPGWRRYLPRWDANPGVRELVTREIPTRCIGAGLGQS